MRIEADGPVIVRVSIALVVVLAAASFSLSFLGMIHAAEWAGIPERLRWLVPLVVDSTILVYAVAATVQRARGENTRISWLAVAFFTAVSVTANAAHVIAPGGVPQELTASVLFGAFLAGVMPISLFFATHTTVQLAVAPVYGSVAQRQRRAAKKLSQAEKMDHSVGHRGTVVGQKRGTLMDQMDHPHGPPVGHRRGTPVGQQMDHLGTARKPAVKVDPVEVLRLNDDEGLSQRAIADRLGISKSTVGRILSDPEKAVADARPVAAASA